MIKLEFNCMNKLLIVFIFIIFRWIFLCMKNVISSLFYFVYSFLGIYSFRCILLKPYKCHEVKLK